jgi:hypothetical protein
MKPVSEILSSILFTQRERPIQPGTPEFSEPEMDIGYGWEEYEDTNEQQEQLPDWIKEMINKEKELTESVQVKRQNWCKTHRMAWKAQHIEELKGKSHVKIMREYYAFCQEHKVKVPTFREDLQLQSIRRSLEGIIPEWEGRTW